MRDILYIYVYIYNNNNNINRAEERKKRKRVMACDALCVIGESGGGLFPSRDHPAHSSPGERKTGKKDERRREKNLLRIKEAKERERVAG